MENSFREHELEEQLTDLHGSVSVVRGTIIGALAGGHLDATPGYGRGILLQIADLLGITLPDVVLTEGEKRHKPIATDGEDYHEHYFDHAEVDVLGLE